MVDLQKLRNALMELKDASLAIENESDYKKTITQYDCLFLGENFNQLNSIELLHTLNEKFDFKITNEHLLQCLPSICESLGMSLEPLQSMDKLGVTSAYFIRLH